MSHLAEILEPGDLTRIRGLQLFAKSVVEGFCTGLHTSPHKGFSVEFKQHRQYTQGDEIRRIDWKVYGRTDRYYIREHEEETNLICTLILDASGSMNYKGLGGKHKYVYAQRLCACLSYVMMMQADAVGLVTFDTEVRRFVPSRSKTSHLRALIETMEDTEVGGETDLSESLRSLVPRIRRRGLVVIVSDMFGDVSSIMKSLAHMRHRGHEIVIFQIWDRDELDFPFKRWTRFINLEDRQNYNQVDPATIRNSYLQRLNAYREGLLHGCRRHRIELVPVVTDQPYSDALGEYLNTRLRQNRTRR